MHWSAANKAKGALRAAAEDIDVRKTAGDAVVGAAQALDGLEAVAQRAGLTKKDGSLSKVRVARAAMRPRTTARNVLEATAAEISDRRADKPPA